MATIAVSSSANWDAITGKTSTGNDTFNISNGAVLTVDTDVRYCNNSSKSFGRINIDATTGGKLNIDGTGVRLIPYNTGTGNVPAVGTTVSQGGVSGYLLGVWASVGGPPTAAGAAMPVSGVIKIRDKSGGSFAAGALTGIGASATGADVVGWINVIARAGTTITPPFIGRLSINGDWFAVGATNGSRGQTLQLPHDSGTSCIAGVWIETSAGSGIYEHYPNAVNITGASLPTSAARGKVVWISSAGVCRIGNDGTNNVGYLPAAGCAVRIPNVLFDSEGVGNVINSTYTGANGSGFTLSTAAPVGEFSIRNANVAGNVSAHSASLRNSGFALQVAILNAGCVVVDCQLGYVNSATSGNSGATVFSMQSTEAVPCSIDGEQVTVFQPFRATTYDPVSLSGSGLIDGLAVIHAGAIAANNPLGITFTNPLDDLALTNTKMIGGQIGRGGLNLPLCKNLTFTDTVFGSAFAGATGGTYTHNVFSFGGSKFENIVINGVSLLPGETNVHPRTSVVSVDATNNCDIRNIGTAASPIDAGSSNAMQYLISNAPGQLGGGRTKLRRIYAGSTLATSIVNNGTTGDTAYYDNISGPYASGQVVSKPPRATFRGVKCTPTLTAQSLCYDNHFHDVFTGVTAGQILLCFNHSVSSGVSAITAGTPYFNGLGAVIMRTVGDQVEWTMPYFALGHTAFANSAPTLTGGTASNYALEYKLDKNDGAGWASSWATLSAANLSAETGISPTLGVKIKIRVTTTTANSDSLTFLQVYTATTATDQDTLYDINPSTVTVTGLVSGSRVRVTRDDTDAVLFNGVESGGAISFSTTYYGSISVEARKASSSTYYKPWSAAGMVGTGVSFIALQIPDE